MSSIKKLSTFLHLFYYYFFFASSLLNLVCILHLEHISIWTWKHLKDSDVYGQWLWIVKALRVLGTVVQDHFSLGGHLLSSVPSPKDEE